MQQNNGSMKVWMIFLCLVGLTAVAQNPCELDADVNDTSGTYKSTKDYLMYERNFGGTATTIHFSTAVTDGLPTLMVQLISKSKDFIKADCLDGNSRLYLQLNNGKIISMIHFNQEKCGSSVRDEKGNNVRILQGIFLFVKDTFDDLEKSGISLMRIKYATGTVDYIIKSELNSETDGKKYNPETYFMKVLPCLSL